MQNKVKWLASADSTNTLAMEMGRQGATPWTVVAAETQTDGRGRLDRFWFSPAGSGLYFSVFFRPSIPTVDLPKITIAAAVAACRAVESVCKLRPQLKWPNDLLLDKKKFGGILAETEAAPDSSSGDSLVVVGFGLNITTKTTDFPSDLKEKATSLFAYSGQKFSRELILTAVVDQLNKTISTIESGGFGQIIAEWRTFDAMQDISLTWLSPGGELVHGRGRGINENGIYLVEDKNGAIHEVMSGDISLAGR